MDFSSSLVSAVPPDPDVMNDPAYDPPSRKLAGTAADELDTCRICRSEGSADEPLFYPCKCSGSIKFVHQACLMDWLAHSRKKHCELCKTPFRFTKLYDPHMPGSVPTLIFLRQAIVHIVGALATWTRWNLVAFVWLGWVPWCMRVAWRALFWMADGGWVASPHFLRELAMVLNQTHESSISTSNSTVASTPASAQWPLWLPGAFLKHYASWTSHYTLELTRWIVEPLLTNTSASSLSNLAPEASATPILRSSWPWSSSSSLGHYLLTSTAGQNGSWPNATWVTHSWSSRSLTLILLPFNIIFERATFLVQMVTHVLLPSPAMPSWVQRTNITTPLQSPSLLSHVSFLAHLTRWPTFNGLIIDVLEGQIITSTMVIAFILIFLIREWVIQQQPVLNLGPLADQDPDLPALDVLAPEVNAAVEPLVDDGHPVGALVPENDGPVGALIPDTDALGALPSETDALGALPSEADTLGGLPSETDALLEAPLDLDIQPAAGPSRVGIEREVSASRAESTSPDRQSLFNDSSVQSSSVERHSTLRSSRHRPPLPPRDTSVMQAVDIRRQVEEQARPSHDAETSLPQTDDGPRSFSINADIDYETDTESPYYGPAFAISSTSDPVRETAHVRHSKSTLENLQDRRRDGDESSDDEGRCSRDFKAANIEGWPGRQSSRRSASNQANRNGGTDDGDVNPFAPDNDEMGSLRDNDMGMQGDSGLHASTAPIGASSSSDPEAPGASASSSAIPNSILPDTSAARSAALLTPDASTATSAAPIAVVPPQQTDEHHGLQARIAHWLWGDIPGLNPDSTESAARDEEGSGQADEEQLLLDRPPDTVPDGRPEVAIPAPLDDFPLAAVDHVDERSAEEARMEEIGARQQLQDQPAVVPDMHREELNEGHDQGAAAIADGPIPLDAEAAEDAEDLEGIMDVIGLQGPLIGLFQNGLISSLFVCLAALIGVWIPYIVGKLVLIYAMNPVQMLVKMPLRWATTIIDLVTDVSILFFVGVLSWIERIPHVSLEPLNQVFPRLPALQSPEFAGGIAEKYTWLATHGQASVTDVPIFSIVAHEELRRVQHHLWSATELALQFFFKAVQFDWNMKALFGQSRYAAMHAWPSVKDAAQSSFETAPALFSKLLSAFTLQINLDYPKRRLPLDITLAYWGPTDRATTVALGYAFFFVLGTLYLRLRPLFRDSIESDRQNPIVLLLEQAGGILKVVLIIGIEMIVFPLYCGSLLDLALLPLFDQATIASRIRFTLTYPATSIFVHWFIGTCYMFHFALFVAMCREIFRTGVLWFIRDPDDPAFHPVRDVLERNVYTQLRKIAFSAFVYGALVVFGLGAVVWSLAATLPGVFPINWSTKASDMDFPFDLLVYNFLMPVAVKYFRPSSSFGAVFGWWFRKCARFLRMSHFLFAERRPDEEGHYTWRSLLSWSYWSGHQTLPQEASVKEEPVDPAMDVFNDASFVKDGRWVRVPASDQVKIPKGTQIFVDVDEDGNRLDGKPDQADGLHGRQNGLFCNVHVPPHFSVRVAVFIVLMWAFAAVVGACCALTPLIMGRLVLSWFPAQEEPVNDVYAFTLGVYLIGGPVTLILHYWDSLEQLCRTPRRPEMQQLLGHLSIFRATARVIRRVSRLVYFYGAFWVVLPVAIGVLFEVYCYIPLHTALQRLSAASSSSDLPVSHTIRVVPDWTLGVLSLMIVVRVLRELPSDRPRRALDALVMPGHADTSWLNPDIRLATRAFILPALVLMSLATIAPFGVGYVATTTIYAHLPIDAQTLVYRLAYPAVFGCLCALALAWTLWRAVGLWRLRVRDEVYLIGERLHNFAEQKPRPSSRHVRRRITVHDGGRL